jgi:transposase, IS30 family
VAVLLAVSPLRSAVIAGLTARQAPAVIAADLAAAGGPRVCAETIYQALYAGRFPLNARDCLRTRRPRRRGRQQRHPNRRAGLPNIALRPAVVNDRSEVGHLELDLIIGKNNRSALLCGLERVTRYGAILTLPEGYRAESVLAAMCELFDQIPPHLRRSVTFDQGSEWADWRCLVEHYDMAVWFCHPHSPWERGGIENFNGHARYWFPRGTDHNLVSAQRADEVTGFINTQRRRILGWDSPEQR